MDRYEIFENLVKKHNVKISDVIKGTGIAKSTIYEWKRGKYEPKFDKFLKICEFLGEDVSVFFPEDETLIMLDELRKANVKLMAGMNELAEDSIRILGPLTKSETLKSIYDICKDMPEEDKQLVLSFVKRLKK